MEVVPQAPMAGMGGLPKKDIHPVGARKYASGFAFPPVKGVGATQARFMTLTEPTPTSLGGSNVDLSASDYSDQKMNLTLLKNNVPKVAQTLENYVLAKIMLRKEARRYKIMKWSKLQNDTTPYVDETNGSSANSKIIVDHSDQKLGKESIENGSLKKAKSLEKYASLRKKLENELKNSKSLQWKNFLNENCIDECDIQVRKIIKQ